MLVRTIVGLIIAVVLLLCLYFGDWVFVTVFSLTFLFSVIELNRAFKSKGLKVFIWPAYILAATGSALYMLTGYDALLLFAYALVLLTASVIGQVLITRDNFSSVLYCPIPFVYPLLSNIVILILYFGLPRATALTACGLAVLAPQAADVFAYLGGTLFGKHKLCPHISPKKTVEGGVCALVGGVAGGVAMYFAQLLWGGPIGLVTLMVLGLVCGIVGQFGDLFASCIKRDAGIKDFSSILPGHGGFLDRIDSTLLCAPIILAYFMILVA